MKVAIALALLLSASAVSAQEPTPQRFGGCSRGGSVCAGPTIAVTLVGYDLDTKKLSTGVMPGLGYGVNIWADKWHTLGLAAYGSIRQQDGNTNGMFSALFSFAEYVRLGIARDVVSATDATPAKGSWVILGGFGADFR